MAEPREANPVDDEELYKSIILGGRASPGQVRSITGHDREMDWDVKVGAGQSGATTTLKAEKPCEVTVTIYLADAEDFDAWPAFRDVVESTVKGKGKALDVYHPDLAANGIKSVVMRSIGGVVHDGKGGQTIAIKLLEYKPPKPKAVSPAGSSAKPKAKEDPNAAANAELARLTAQYQATPWGGPLLG